MNTLSLVMLTPLSLSAPEDGRRFLAILEEFAPRLTPRLYGNFEPIRTKYDDEAIESILESWRSPFLWKGERGVSGSVWPRIGPRPTHTAIAITAPGDLEAKEQAQALLCKCALEFNLHFGLIHQVRPEEISTMYAAKIAIAPRKGATPSLFVTTHVLNMFIPGVFQLMLWGEPYVNMLTRDAILSLPNTRTQELENGSILTSLESEGDLLELPWKEYSAITESVKSHLGSDFFIDPHDPKKAARHIPEFGIGGQRNHEPKPVGFADGGRLVAAAVDAAVELIGQFGGFLPFAEVLNNRGEMELVGVAPESDSQSVADMAEVLIESLRNRAALNLVVACVVAIDVRIGNQETQDSTDAIFLSIEERSGLARSLYIPYRIESGAFVECGVRHEESAESRVFIDQSSMSN